LLAAAHADSVGYGARRCRRRRVSSADTAGIARNKKLKQKLRVSPGWQTHRADARGERFAPDALLRSGFSPFLLIELVNSEVFPRARRSPGSRSARECAAAPDPEMKERVCAMHGVRESKRKRFSRDAPTPLMSATQISQIASGRVGCCAKTMKVRGKESASCELRCASRGERQRMERRGAVGNLRDVRAHRKV
jgi:hypothetical protein